MEKYLFVSTILCCLAVGVLSDLKAILDQEPCLKDDMKCFTEYTRTMFKTLVSGDEELDIKSIDPAFIERVDGNLAFVKYTLYNSTLTGFATCDVQQASILPEKQNFKFDILCPEFYMSGVYDVNGTLVILPVYGNGDYWIKAKVYKIKVDTEIAKYQGEDGKDYIEFKTFKFEPDLQGSLDFDVTNLFGGNKDLSEPFLRFARGYWRVVARQLQDPPVSAFLNLLIDNFNVVLKSVPLESMIKD